MNNMRFHKSTITKTSWQTEDEAETKKQQLSSFCISEPSVLALKVETVIRVQERLSTAVRASDIPTECAAG